MRVICAGHVNWDVTLYVDRLPSPDDEASIRREVQSGGGSAPNVATALAGLGVDASVLGSVGDDEYGHLARRELADAGVGVDPLVTVDGGHTAVKYLVVDGDGEVMVLGNDGANEAFGVSDLSDATLTGADHLHLTSQDPDTAAALADRADAAGLTVSVDPGRRLEDRDFAEAVARADLVFLNEREASTAIEGYLDAPDDLDSTVVFKHGAAGAELLTPDGGYDSHPGFPVEAVDTTGAGDAFAAGFLAAWLDGDRERALSVANACGALASRERGARIGITWAAVESVVEGSEPGHGPGSDPDPDPERDSDPDPEPGRDDPGT